jgi:UDP-N-acetyl-D-glucosamine dehydrogenase
MNETMKIAIVGLGYVGLPLSLQFARSGVAVLGLDVDAAKVDALHQGKSYIKHIPSETVAEAVRAGTFSAATDFGRIREVDAIIICVPTPPQQESGAGHFLHPRHRQKHSAASANGHARSA